MELIQFHSRIKMTLSCRIALRGDWLEKAASAMGACAPRLGLWVKNHKRQGCLKHVPT